MGVEEIVVATVVIHEAPLFRVRSRRVERNLACRVPPRTRDALHRHLVEVVPKAAIVHLVRAAAERDQVRINGVIRLRRSGRYTDAAVVGPRTGVHSTARRDANGGALAAKCGHGVVEIVRRANQMHVGSPEVLVTGEVNGRARRKYGAFVTPRTSDGRSGGDRDLIARAEAEVGLI